MEKRYLDSVFLRQPPETGAYWLELPAVRWLLAGNRLTFERDVTFLVGENGSGKSTLLEAIAVACGFNAEGGTKNFNFSTQATHSSLCQYLTAAKRAYPRDGFFLRAESFYNVASQVDRMEEEDSGLLRSYGGVSLHGQSHGESFLSLVEHRFGGDGLYLLDEPEAALSPSRLMTLLVHIRDLVGRNSQFIIATHSPILMAYPEAQVLLLGEEGIVRTTYRETEHYRLTRQFLEQPERMMKYLFEEEPM